MAGCLRGANDLLGGPAVAEYLVIKRKKWTGEEKETAT